ncbi:hypothetical protein L596_018422 [Steinernema carpocapsae]|uniref:Uncharacterized protein n=1 Tax=Steinernema carpocapsae TaxID=34508 RepID=A0A4U5N5L7_STECR|nr:hypothetical protein L596_018422 [Steinernema carpocapsae]
MVIDLVTLCIQVPAVMFTTFLIVLCTKKPLLRTSETMLSSTDMSKFKVPESNSNRRNSRSASSSSKHKGKIVRSTKRLLRQPSWRSKNKSRERHEKEEPARVSGSGSSSKVVVERTVVLSLKGQRSPETTEATSQDKSNCTAIEPEEKPEQPKNKIKMIHENVLQRLLL